MNLKETIENILSNQSPALASYFYEREDLANVTLDDTVCPAIIMLEFGTSRWRTLSNRIEERYIVTLKFVNTVENFDNADTNDSIIQDMKDLAKSVFKLLNASDDLLKITDLQVEKVKETNYDACVCGVALTFETGLVSETTIC